MILEFTICRNEHDKPLVHISENGFSLTSIPVENCTEILIPLWESCGDTRTEAIKDIAGNLDESDRMVDFECLGKPGDGTIRKYILERFCLE